MSVAMYPPSSAELGNLLRSLAPGIQDAFRGFSERVFADGALLSSAESYGARVIHEGGQDGQVDRGDRVR
jgi:hypothetical protein